MDLTSILTFTGAIFIFMATPGMGVVAIISRSLSSGFKHASFMVGGMVLGDMIFLLLSIFGLGLIASRFDTIFEFIKILGGIYVIYLGVKMFLAKVSRFEVSVEKKPSYTSDFLSGLFITLGNSKVIAFYVGFLPTFLDMSKMNYRDILIVTSLVLGLLTIILTTYAYFASKLRETIKKPKIQNIMNKTTGVTMILIGAFLIVWK